MESAVRELFSKISFAAQAGLVDLVHYLENTNLILQKRVCRCKRENSTDRQTEQCNIRLIHRDKILLKGKGVRWYVGIKLGASIIMRPGAFYVSHGHRYE